jgi:hypothetical protein
MVSIVVVTRAALLIARTSIVAAFDNKYTVEIEPRLKELRAPTLILRAISVTLGRNGKARQGVRNGA